MEELFKDYGKVFIRTPLYSYLSLFDNNETKDLDDLVRWRLHDPVFMEALYWSSPQLFEAVLKFKEGGLKGAKEKKLLQTLKKYLIRASTRCTPYGIYAGTAIAGIGLKQENQNQVTQRKVRIDMGLLQTLKSAIESDASVYPHLLYSLNNSLYRIPGQYRFMETIIENGSCHYQLSSLEHSQFLEEIVMLSKNRMVSVDDIYSLAEKDTPKEEFNCFINELIKSQFLVSELQIGLTAGDESERYTDVLKRLTEKGVDEAQKYLQVFSLIQNILLRFDQSTIGELPLQQIKDLKELLNECGIADTCHLFHADLKQAIPDGFTFSKEKVKEIEQGIVALGKLGCSPSPKLTEIEHFKKLFREKYETREIPLAEALDPEFGIGFPAKDGIGNNGFNALIENFGPAPGNSEKNAENQQPWLQDNREALDGYILNQNIVINEDELKDPEDKTCDLPTTFSVMGNLLPSGKILLEMVAATHANSLPGRFAYLDEEMMKVCKVVSKKESQIHNEVIFAEIIFIPEGRTGNIARRPVLSDYELPLLARSGLKEEHQLPVGDLLVSVQHDEIILRSKKLDKRIIPRLSNAHNYTNSLVPAYQFLCAIQHQGKSSFGISWRDFEFKKRFLPRIAYRNIIFHRACWFLYKRDITTISKADDPLAELQRFFLRWNVPRYICLAEADNELLIDTHNVSYLELLLEEIKLRTHVKLVEWLYGTELPTPVQQFILPLSQKNVRHLKPLCKTGPIQHTKRKFEPGSEWVYFKIYCGSTVSDKILLNVVKPVINLLIEKAVVKVAFFIRFTDPHYHIRFRLQLAEATNKEHLATVMSIVYGALHPFCESGLVWKVQLDTYEREIERYGAKGISEAEILFFHDSLLYLNCLADEEFGEDHQIRFLSALKNIDRWLTMFNMSTREKADYCTDMSDSFGKEFKSSVKLQVDLKYRELKMIVPPFLNADKYNIEFTKRDKALNKKKLPKENLSSFIHMSMNRWFIIQQRLMEYMCYIFLCKYYNQILHQNKRIPVCRPNT